jgi:hypothetical protein
MFKQNQRIFKVSYDVVDLCDIYNSCSLDMILYSLLLYIKSCRSLFSALVKIGSAFYSSSFSVTMPYMEVAKAFTNVKGKCGVAILRVLTNAVTVNVLCTLCTLYCLHFYTSQIWSYIFLTTVCYTFLNTVCNLS